MANIILQNPCQAFLSRTSTVAQSKKNKLHHHIHGRAFGSMNHLECKNMNITSSSFNYRSSACVPLHEASFDEYIDGKGRVIQSIFPEKSTSLQLNQTRVEFPDMNVDYIPQDFNINERGALYMERQGRHKWMKNQLDINVNLAFSPLLAWVLEEVLQNIFQSVLRNYVEDANKGYVVRLLADHSSFKRNKPKKLV
ncbi:hypothetical protein VNO78_33871 [Psophocarpus tetragonolobus]|uniref:Uncharacterized protein n=1 Tax=Psophocarpus tetragonolobus TaxID=3891 RepID=A0AAN9NYZ6_PSOTE